ncbi:hypothetical protein GCM10011507_22870 [Edaphobacter acidisoli]|uniref:Fibronectin type-III domain-containing protein n=1 Tax=Edaphobacter acidisoli TaxID=2040573 RepID=A0A916W6N4_9BACT|nr:hypothetical protein [Edaphobacter acidisoli]GGA70721.1 hypothetical protein GCM10011507_22870 [Edaphobacter acidisoli]
MKHAFTRGRWPAALATLGITIAIGCASPGPPMPPSLHLPKVVNDLSARRIGDAVELHWTTPLHTTDGLDIKGAVTAEICRASLSASAQPSKHSDCTPIKRTLVHPGATSAVDALPAALATGQPALLLYRVRLFNSNDRTAGPSAPAFTAAGAAPSPVEQLHASSSRSGIVLEWKPGTAPVPIELDRTQLNPPQKKSKPSPAAPKSKPTHSFNLVANQAVEVRLQAANQPSDRGGTLDRSAQKGETYRYTAQRVNKVILGGHSLEIRSAISAPITITLLDIFPPATPTGLAAIPGNRSIDLSWEPVSDTDLAGYIVYRQQTAADGSASGPFTRITQTPIVGPAFSDQTATPGRSYIYRVTAIDTTGNESSPSATAQETLPEQQQ